MPISISSPRRSAARWSPRRCSCARSPFRLARQRTHAAGDHDGLVKVCPAPHRRYSYYLTPQELRRKAGSLRTICNARSTSTGALAINIRRSFGASVPATAQRAWSWPAAASVQRSRFSLRRARSSCCSPASIPAPTSGSALASPLHRASMLSGRSMARSSQAWVLHTKPTEVCRQSFRWRIFAPKTLRITPDRAYLLAAAER